MIVPTWVMITDVLFFEYPFHVLIHFQYGFVTGN